MIRIEHRAGFCLERATHLHDLHKPVNEDSPHADIDVVLHDLHVCCRRAPLELRTNPHNRQLAGNLLELA